MLAGTSCAHGGAAAERGRPSVRIVVGWRPTPVTLSLHPAPGVGQPPWADALCSRCMSSACQLVSRPATPGEKHGSLTGICSRTGRKRGVGALTGTPAVASPQRALLRASVRCESHSCHKVSCTFGWSREAHPAVPQAAQCASRAPAPWVLLVRLGAAPSRGCAGEHKWC
jgi:hypothetical protein